MWRSHVERRGIGHGRLCRRPVVALELAQAAGSTVLAGEHREDLRRALVFAAADLVAVLLGIGSAVRAIVDVGTALCAVVLLLACLFGCLGSGEVRALLQLGVVRVPAAGQHGPGGRRRKERRADGDSDRKTIVEDFHRLVLRLQSRTVLGDLIFFGRIFYV